MGSPSLLQRIFPTQELNWSLLHCRWILYQLSCQGTKKIQFDCLPKKEVSLFTVKILIYIYAWKKEIRYLDYGRVQIRSLVICVSAQSLSHIRLFATLSVGFSRQEYWSGLPFPPLRDLPNPEVEPMCLALADRLFTTEPPGKTLPCY